MSNREKTVLMIGETLLILQKIERFIAMALMNMVSSTNPDEKLAKALHRDRETLGRLISYFAERTELPVHFAEVFETLLKDRNIFVHDLFMQPWFDLSTESGCAEVNEFMRRIRTSAKVVIKVLMGALTPQHTDAIRPERDKKYIDQILHRVNATALPDFGGRSEGEYIESVSADVKVRFSVKRRDA
jgi:hypothetical protein